jgi:hypothetical protein
MVGSKLCAVQFWHFPIVIEQNGFCGSHLTNFEQLVMSLWAFVIKRIQVWWCIYITLGLLACKLSCMEIGINFRLEVVIEEFNRRCSIRNIALDCYLIMPEKSRKRSVMWAGATEILEWIYCTTPFRASVYSEIWSTCRLCPL